MTFALEGVQPTYVPMSPDQIVQWEKVEYASGSLYAGPACTREIAQRAIAFSNPDAQDWLPEVPESMEGVHGIVLPVGEVAYKRSHQIAPDWSMGLSALKVSATFAHGLKQSAETETLLAADGEHCRITSPDYFAGFVPDARPGRRPGLPRNLWAMSYEPGRRPWAEELPEVDARQAVYHQAVRRHQMQPSKVDFDDKLANMLVRDNPDAGIREIVKIDLMAVANRGLFRRSR